MLNYIRKVLTKKKRKTMDGQGWRLLLFVPYRRSTNTHDDKLCRTHLSMGLSTTQHLQNEWLHWLSRPIIRSWQPIANVQTPVFSRLLPRSINSVSWTLECDNLDMFDTRREREVREFRKASDSKTYITSAQLLMLYNVRPLGCHTPSSRESGVHDEGKFKLYKVI